MTANGWLQIAVFLALILAITKPLGVFMAGVFSGEHTFLDPVLRPVEHLLYRVTGVDEKHEMRWTEYAFAMLLFSGVSMLLLYLIERVQQVLPWNPQTVCRGAAGALAFNTAASFTTNTNWQNYSGETHHELLHADGRPRLSQLRFRGGRHCSGHRRDSRHRAPGDKTPSAISGSI